MKITVYLVTGAPLIIENAHKIEEVKKKKISVYREGQPPLDLKPCEVTGLVADPNY